ncbi:MAG: agmatine deiminase family protein [bacterium]|nr:agmatine deiminase family protein [bacterium]
MPSSILRRPTPKQLARFFAAVTRAAAPPRSKIYRNHTPSPVAAISEFAPMGAVLIAYPGAVPPPAGREQLPPSGPRSFGIPNELIIRMQQNDSDEPVRVFVMCDDESAKATICSDLEHTAEEKGLAFNPDYLHLIGWDTDTFWTRDYGPWWIRNEETGYYGIAKHSYTTLGGGSVGLVEGAENVDPHKGLGIFRPNDDYGAVKVSDYLNAPIRAWNGAAWGTDEENKKKLPPIPVHNWLFTGLLDVGGNYMVTGTGLIASSYLVATQNELPVSDQSHVTNPPDDVIEERMEYILEQLNRFMGIHTYHVLSDPTGTYIGHIDCWGKFLAENKVLIASSKDGEIGAAFNAIAKSFQAEGFEVYRVLCQDVYVPTAVPPATTAAYTNSLILNDHVYVPLAGAGYEKCDQDALAAYQKALPDHCIVGIAGKPEFPWLGTDAMHCRTRGIPRDVVNNWLKASNPPE